MQMGSPADCASCVAGPQNQCVRLVYLFIMQSNDDKKSIYVCSSTIY